MAMETRIRVPENEAFPHGVYAFASAEVEMARDFEKSSKDNPVQEIDKQTGLRVWNFEVLDADPNARGKDAVIRVKILSDLAPTLPPAPDGSPFRAVAFENLMGTPYVDSQRCRGGGNGQHRCGGKLAWSWRATGITAPKPTSAARPRNEKQDGS